MAGLDRIIASPAFQSSKRAHDFLRYIVEHALAGDPGHLKERSIGVAVFGREPDYDTGADAVVRVAANDLRKRLMRYYLEAGAHETVIFELPSGSYIPEIHLCEAIPVERDTPAPAIMLSPPEVFPVPAPRVSSRWRLAAIGGWTMALVIAAWRIWLPATAPDAAPAKSLQRLPWAALFDGSRPPVLVMADSSMGILRDLKMFPVSLEDYVYRRFLDPAPEAPPGVARSWRLLAEKRLTSIADARIASEFQRLATGAGRAAVIRPARDLQLNDFRRADNIVLLGSGASNPWVELFQDQLDFQIQLDPEHPRQTVRIRNPNPRDPTGLLESVSTGHTGDSYASLALVRGLDGKGHVLIAQGTSMEGTDLAGDLALNVESLAAILRGCGISATDRNARFELLLRLHAMAGDARGHEVLAVHCHR
jgi:hypothetical protein